MFLQDIIHEAMASIHCVPTTPSAVQQQAEVEQSEATRDSPTASSQQNPSRIAGIASYDAISAAAARQTPADSSEDTASCTDNPNTTNQSPARSASTCMALLLLSTCVTAAIPFLLLLLVQPASYFAPIASAPGLLAANTTATLPILPQFAPYSAIAAATTGAGAAAKRTEAAAAVNSSQGALQPAAVPVNFMLSCPKEWQCRYPKPQLAPWLAGTSMCLRVVGSHWV
jgi:hypothetical protein